MAAKMDKEEDGSHFVRLQVAITDPVAIQKVMDKRYLTGSVGGRAGKAVCSISGEDLANVDESGRPRPARFKRGQIYKGKLAYIDMQDISFKEYSFVNQPADSKSSVRTVKSSGSDSVSTTDSEWVARSSAFVLHMDKEDIFSIEENQSIFAELKNKESRPLYLQVKGAFLSAMAVQESENYINTNDSLLSNGNDTNDAHEENLTMNENVKEDDILTTVEELSQDLSTIAGASSEESEEVVEEEVEEIVEESQEVSEEETVTEADSASVASALQKVLNDTVVFYFAAHRAHWSVEGEDFTQYHELFSNIYEDAIGSVDNIAENIRKCQSFPANLTEVVMNSSFKDDCDCKDWAGMAEMLLEKNNMVNASVMAAFTAATSANEQGIANFMAERDDKHKKWAWQLRSSLKMEVEEPGDESWKNIGSTEITEKQDELAVEAVDSEVVVVTEENQANEASEAELTDTNVVSEQVADEVQTKLQKLEEENTKLRSAMHRTLVERVVDAKIAAGVEPQELREELIQDHATRNASSLADSLRDLAKMPVVKTVKNSMLEMTSEVAVVEGEDNVITEDKVEEVKEEVASVPEQLFVDALMGRRKL